MAAEMNDLLHFPRAMSRNQSKRALLADYSVNGGVGCIAH